MSNYADIRLESQKGKSLSFLYRVISPDGEILAENIDYDDAFKVAKKYFCENIELDEEFRTYMPPLDANEYQALKESILAKGIETPLIFWKPFADYPKYILVDGHNRYKIAQELGVEFDVMFYDHTEKNRKEILEEMEDIQLTRRNLNPEAKAYFFAKKWQKQKSEGVTSEQFAQENDISRRQVFDNVKVAAAIDAVNANFRQEILGGKSGVNKGDLVGLGKALSNEPTKKGIASFQNIPETGSLPLPENKEELREFLQKEVKKPTKTEPLTPADANTGVLFDVPTVQVGFRLPKKETVVEISNDYMYVFGFDYAFLDEVRKVQKKGHGQDYKSWQDVLHFFDEFKEFQANEHKQYIVDAATIEAILKRLSVLNSDIYHKHEVGSRYVIGIPYEKKKDGTINIFSYFKYEKYPTQASDVQKQFLDDFELYFLEKIHEFKQEGATMDSERLYQIATIAAKSVYDNLVYNEE